MVEFDTAQDVDFEFLCGVAVVVWIGSVEHTKLFVEKYFMVPIGNKTNK